MGTDSQVENTWIKLLNCFLMVLITIWGLNKAYKANTEIDGKDFFKRFFAISWVIGMRMLSVIMFIAFLLGAILVIISLANDTYPGKNLYKDMTATIFMSLFEVIYYLLIINSIRKLKPITE